MRRLPQFFLLSIYSAIPVLLSITLIQAVPQLSLLIIIPASIIIVLVSTFLLNQRLGDSASQLIKEFQRLEDVLESGETQTNEDFEPPNSLGSELHLSFQKYRDIAIRKIEKLLSENQELSKRYSQFQLILARMSEGVLLLDTSGKVLYCNQSAGTLLGRDPEEIEKRLLWEIVRTPGLEQSIGESITSGSALRDEFEIQRTHRVVEMSAVQLDVDSGNGLVIVLHDFTELRRLEKLRREFVSNVSHELKTPLTSIQIYTDTLLEGGLEDTEYSRSFVERIQEQSERLQQLIQDMLRLARIEAQSEAFHLESVALCQIVSESVQSRLAIAEARGIELSFESLNEEPITIMGDIEGVRTIFDNLINNALNYTSSSGEVDVRCGGSAGFGFVEIKDTGIGISKEHHARVFERFYRVDKARSRGMGGTGLGLAIVKHCVNEFNGKIELESELGKGTLFRISFPLANKSVVAFTS